MLEALERFFERTQPVTELELLGGDKGTESRVVVLDKSVQVQSLEEYQKTPNRINAKVTLTSVNSFVQYVSRFADDETTIFLDCDKGLFRSVLDHYGPSVPKWGSHVCSFGPTQSLEWKAWRSIHKKALAQREFAEFIEENLNDIISPEPNEVLKAALQFQHAEKMALASAQNLDDGTMQFHLTKENAPAQDISFPHRITLNIPVYENEQKDKYEARIRYRADSNGMLSFTFSFVKNPTIIRRDKLTLIAEQIQQNLVGLHLYEGI